MSHRAAIRMFLSALGTVVCAACTVTEPDVAVGFTLASRTATRDSLGFAEIGFQVTNAGTTALYLPRCGVRVSADVEQRTPAITWTLATSGSLGCASSLALGPYRLEVGQSVTSVERVRIAPGVIRLRLPVFRDAMQRTGFVISSDEISVS